VTVGFHEIRNLFKDISYHCAIKYVFTQSVVLNLSAAVVETQIHLKNCYPQTPQKPFPKSAPKTKVNK
jgi:hypothetical protein